MSKEVWRSRDKEIVTSYAERLEQGAPEARALAEEQSEAGEDEASAGVAKAKKPYSGPVEVDFSYNHGAIPPRDLLNYKNMDLEMSLWARTQTGWLSVGLLLLLVAVCFLMTFVAWKLRGF